MQNSSRMCRRGVSDCCGLTGVDECPCHSAHILHAHAMSFTQGNASAATGGAGGRATNARRTTCCTIARARLAVLWCHPTRSSESTVNHFCTLSRPLHVGGCCRPHGQLLPQSNEELRVKIDSCVQSICVGHMDSPNKFLVLFFRCMWLVSECTFAPVSLVAAGTDTDTCWRVVGSRSATGMYDRA